MEKEILECGHPESEPIVEMPAYFASNDDYGIFSCADDYEDAQRIRRNVIDSDMP